MRERAGKFYFEHLAAGRYSATVQYADGTCALTIEVPASAGAVVQLGTVRCAASVAEGVAITTSASVSCGVAGVGFSALPGGTIVLLAAMPSASTLTLDRTTVTLTVIAALRDCADRSTAESTNTAQATIGTSQRMS